MKRNKKGFTIVELVIVIGVIGILSAILIPTFVTLTAKAQDAARKEECASAYTLYAAAAIEDQDVKYLSRDDVALAKEGHWFTFTNENGWSEYTVPATNPYNTKVGTTDEKSTYNTYVFWYHTEA